MCYILFQLDTPVNAKGPVELWLFDLLKMQQSSLHCVIRGAFYQISDPSFQLLNFLYHFPAQVRNLKTSWCSNASMRRGWIYMPIINKKLGKIYIILWTVTFSLWQQMKQVINSVQISLFSCEHYNGLMLTNLDHPLLIDLDNGLF